MICTTKFLVANEKGKLIIRSYYHHYMISILNTVSRSHSIFFWKSIHPSGKNNKGTFILITPVEIIVIFSIWVLVTRTNLFFFVRMLPLDGEVGIEMTNSLSETRLQYCTTHRLGGIFEVVNTRKDLRRRLTSLRIA